MTNKLTAASGTNPFITSVWTKTKSLNPDYSTSITYTGIFEFAKAQNKYYSESTAHSRAETYKPWQASYKNVTKDVTLEQISKHTLELLVNTLKEEVNTNIVLKDRIAVMENKMLSPEKKHAVLEQAEKNRKDKNHREQLMKYCLIMFAGFALFGLIQWL